MAEQRIGRLTHASKHPGMTGAERARRVLIGLDVVFALGAIAGGLLLVLYPGGEGPMQFELEYLEGSPFANYFIPGLFLTGLGLGAVLASYLHVRRHPLAPHLSFVCGALLVTFELVELTMIPFSALQPIYIVVGLAMAALAFRVERHDDSARSATNALARHFTGH